MILNKKNIKSAQRFRKIINDLKRRPEDAANDLGVKNKKILNILDGSEELSFEIIKKASEVWPVNISDFFTLEDDTNPHGYRIFTKEQSDKSSRKMYRNNKPYYLYKDTVMTKISSFRPEWIQELQIVENNDPENEDVRFNNGHFLHQFTYFIGPVNFYYIDRQGKKHVEKMNTGDSMYISPYTPHSFTTRINNENELGVILALTYSDKIDNQTIDEIMVVGENSKNFRINYSNKVEAFFSNIELILKNNALTFDACKEKIDIDFSKLIRDKKLPDNKQIEKLSSFLNLSNKDLFPTDFETDVKVVRKSNRLKWFYPNEANKEYLIHKLADVKQLPNSQAFEMDVLQEKTNSNLETGCHQYIYNIGDSECKVTVNNNETILLKNNYSMYLKPNVIHKFEKKSKILILRIGGKVSGEALCHYSMVSNSNIDRFMSDNKQWFN